MKFYWSSIWQDESAHAATQVARFKQICALLEPFTGSLKKKRVLDLGCGRMFPMTMLFEAAGINAVGFDRAYMGPHAPLSRRLRGSYQAEGFMGMCKEGIIALLKEHPHRRVLSERSGLKIHPHVMLVRGDARLLPFPNGSFDAVVSIAVLEHIDIIPSVVDETYRILVSGGACCHMIHLFPSLSGGHHPLWQHPESVPSNQPFGVPPWDHLHSDRFVFDPTLNRLRKTDYLAAFRRKFEVRSTEEPEVSAARFLTPHVRRELNGYSDEELLTRTLILVGHK